MAHEFEELALDGHNYPTWAMDVKISLALEGCMRQLFHLQKENKHCLLHISTMLHIL
jgi:hypothetical protein